MGKQSIAIIGLGSVGAAFPKELLSQSSSGVEIVATENIACMILTLISSGVKLPKDRTGTGY